MEIGYFKTGLGRTPHLEALLDAPCRRLYTVFGKVVWGATGVTHIAGWGLKPTARFARCYAQQHGLPFLSLEDGFLRSLGLGVQGALLHSLIADQSGIYYDATAPSDLESMIAASELSADEHQRAVLGIGLMRQHRLSKYNHAPDYPLFRHDLARPRVLVVDQTLDDSSIKYGLADAQAFLRMLDDAITDNPEAEVMVKVHPDVIAGYKQGYLREAAEARGCRLIGDDLSPWALLDGVQQVYVVTSQLGFEALLAGKKVHCYGMPFYAGWGLTVDQLICGRRSVSRSLEQVFAAAYLQYCRYINPYTGERCEFEDTVRMLSEQLSEQTVA